MFISLVKDPNVQFVRVRQDFFAHAIICPNFTPFKSHFVQENVVWPVPAVPAVPTFWTPGYPKCLYPTLQLTSTWHFTVPLKQCVKAYLKTRLFCGPIYGIKNRNV